MATKLTIKKDWIFDGPKGKPGFKSMEESDKGTKCHQMSKGPQGKEFKQDLLEKVNQKIEKLKIDIANEEVEYGNYQTIIEMGKALNVLKHAKIDLEEEIKLMKIGGK